MIELIQFKGENDETCSHRFRQVGPRIEIVGRNLLISESNKNSGGDDLNVYNSSGAAASPYDIHDNYVQGAYPEPRDRN
ncbi:MAG: hypothetical protein H7222_03350 [Methylotenera sp.]|nr:hypothetical protein [Oligoflexia bacterium]